MSHQVDGDDAGAHKHDYRDQRAIGQSRHPADAMAAGAAIAQTCADADQQPGNDQPLHRKVCAGRLAGPKQPDAGCDDQPGKKRDAPAAFAALFDRPVDDAADAGNAIDAGIQQGRCEADQRAADERCDGREFRRHRSDPVDGNLEIANAIAFGLGQRAGADVYLHRRQDQIGHGKRGVAGFAQLHEVLH